MTPQTARRRILLTTIPREGEVRDRLTPAVYKPGAVRYMPLGILSVAAGLRNRHEVHILDASSRDLTVDQTLEEIERVRPDVLGLSAVTYRAWAMRELLRRSSVPIKVVGGPHTTHNADRILAQGAQAVFVHDAEESFQAWLDDGCPPGVFAGKTQDLNTIPFPSRDLVSLDDYRIATSSGLMFSAGALRIPMFSSKGCPMRCIFCDVQQKEYNKKSPARMLEEFQELLALGATSIHVLDDTFNVWKDRVIDFCTLLEKSGLTLEWSVRGTVETREEIIQALARTGCRRFHVGIEHLEDPMLAYLRKGHRTRDVERFCELCRRHGIQILAYLIMGTPGESRSYRERLPGLLRDLGIELPFFNILTPLADTEFYHSLLQTGIYKTDFWAEFCKEPVRDFVIPCHRAPEEEEELQTAIAHLIRELTPPLHQSN